MIARTGFRSIHWILLAIALAPTAALAGQDPRPTEPAQVKTEETQKTTEAAQENPEATKEKKEEPQAKTEEPKAEAEAQAQEDGKLISVPGSKALGMSILGNQEAPTALVIVPWKSSELGGSMGISTLLDDSRQPVDKEVFLRALRYYEIRSEPARSNDAPVKSNVTPSVTAANRRNP